MLEQTRQTVSILFSDFTGNTTAAEDTSHGPGSAARGAREALQALAEKHRGEWVREVAGGALCVFETTAGAMSCALEIQRSLASEVQSALRVGIHIGELEVRKTERGTEVFGDAIVVAARLPGFAERGGICISGRVYQNLPRDRQGMEFEYLGEKPLENVSQPVPVYQFVDPERAPVGQTGNQGERAGTPRSRWLLPLSGVAVAAGLALIAALWVSRFESDRPVVENDVTGSERVVAVPQQPEASRLAAFAAVRDDLLTLASNDLGVRVRTIPDPVNNGALYQVEFEADCDCSVLLFAANAMTEEIALLYPNNFEPKARITRGAKIRIPSSPEWRLRAVGSEGVDVLVLIAVQAVLAFPADRGEPWVVRPDHGDRVEELAKLLERVQADIWGAAEARLQIVP
jgi:class 3 adenylate cyclase